MHLRRWLSSFDAGTLEPLLNGVSYLDLTATYHLAQISFITRTSVESMSWSDVFLDEGGCYFATTSVCCISSFKGCSVVSEAAVSADEMLMTREPAMRMSEDDRIESCTMSAFSMISFRCSYWSCSVLSVFSVKVMRLRFESWSNCSF